MTGAASNKTPVKLEDVQIVPGKQNTEEILMNKRTKISVVKSLDFKCVDEIKPSTSTMSLPDKVTNIFEIKKEVPEYQKVNVTVKIVEIGDVVPVDVRGELLKKQVLVVADKTGNIELTIWKEMTDRYEVGQSVKLTNLSVRVYGNRKSLTTTLSTTVEIIDDLKEVVDDFTRDECISAVGKVEQIILHANYQCANCKKKIQEVGNGKYTRCTHCQMKQLSSSLSRSFYANLNFVSEGQKEKLTMFSSVLTTFVTSCGKSNLLDDTEELEEFFLEANNIKVVYTDDKIVKKMMMVKSTDASAVHSITSASSATDSG